METLNGRREKMKQDFKKNGLEIGECLPPQKKRRSVELNQTLKSVGV